MEICGLNSYTHVLINIPTNRIWSYKCEIYMGPNGKPYGNPTYNNT